MSNLEQARQFFLDGVAHFEADRFEQAERSFGAALSLAPGRPSVLSNLGVTRLRLGRFADALPLLEEAAQAEPGNAETWMHLGTAHAELGAVEAALEALERALALDRTQPGIWSRRGSLLRELRRLDEAAECFEQALALGAEPQLHGYYLAAVRAARDGTVPPAPPRGYVESLFDRYAEDFQSHLAELKYQAPQVLLQGLGRLGATRYGAVLDLGCGTGLVGTLLASQRQAADRIDGVDLSSAMVGQARATGAYTTVAHADVTDHLQAAAAAPQRYGLVMAADVFIYVGALDAVFAGVARVLAPQGLFAFSVELDAAGAELQLMPSLRYAHSEAYVRRLAAAHGMAVRRIERAPLREDQGRPVEGLYVYLQGH